MNTTPDEKGTAAQLPPGAQPYYARHAAALAERYEALTFDAVHREILPFLPPAPARAADIGAGTGRDAAALARLGYDVTAVEPASPPPTGAATPRRPTCHPARSCGSSWHCAMRRS